MRYGFSKSEKLCGTLRIQQLYHDGRHFVCWPLRVTYRETQADATQVLIWAPKSLFRHAVDRNRLRRLMREAYRLNKHILVEKTPQQHFEIAFNYIEKQQQPLFVIERAICKALKRIVNNIEVSSQS